METSSRYPVRVLTRINSHYLEPAMINWPEMLHHAEDWAAGFWAGTGAASLMVIAGAGMVLLFRGI